MGAAPTDRAEDVLVGSKGIQQIRKLEDDKRIHKEVQVE